MGFPGLCKILFEQCIFLFTDVCEFSVWKFINVNIHSVSKKKKKKVVQNLNTLIRQIYLRPRILLFFFFFSQEDKQLQCLVLF